MLPPRGNIHVYYHNIQTSSSLKLKQILYEASIGMGNVYINNSGHMTKMTVMPKNLLLRNRRTYFNETWMMKY